MTITDDQLRAIVEWADKQYPIGNETTILRSYSVPNIRAMATELLERRASASLYDAEIRRVLNANYKLEPIVGKIERHLGERISELLIDKAIVEVNRLRAHVERLRGALEPFAKNATETENIPKLGDWWHVAMSLGDLRRARAAYEETAP